MMNIILGIIKELPCSSFHRQFRITLPSSSKAAPLPKRYLISKYYSIHFTISNSLAQSLVQKEIPCVTTFSIAILKEGRVHKITNIIHISYILRIPSNQHRDILQNLSFSQLCKNP